MQTIWIGGVFGLLVKLLLVKNCIENCLYAMFVHYHWYRKAILAAVLHQNMLFTQLPLFNQQTSFYFNQWHLTFKLTNLGFNYVFVLIVQLSIPTVQINSVWVLMDVSGTSCWLAPTQIPSVPLARPSPASSWRETFLVSLPAERYTWILCSVIVRVVST